MNPKKTELGSHWRNADQNIVVFALRDVTGKPWGRREFLVFLLSTVPPLFLLPLLSRSVVTTRPIVMCCCADSSGWAAGAAGTAAAAFLRASPYGKIARHPRCNTGTHLCHCISSYFEQANASRGASMPPANVFFLPLPRISSTRGGRKRPTVLDSNSGLTRFLESWANTDILSLGRLTNSVNTHSVYSRP